MPQSERVQRIFKIKYKMNSTTTPYINKKRKQASQRLNMTKMSSRVGLIVFQCHSFHVRNHKLTLFRIFTTSK